MKHYKNIQTISIIMHIIGFVSIFLLFKNKINNEMQIHYQLVSQDTSSIETIETALMNELIYRGCILPNVAIAQFRIESGHYKSRLFLECNNVAGIRTSKSELVIGYKYGHCVYASVEDCVQDYIDIQNRYLLAIDGRYAESEQYISTLQQMK